MMTRREALKTTALAGAAAAYATMATSTNAQQQPTPSMTPHSESTAPAVVPGPFTLPPLPYAYDALEPHIDALTMQIHHDKHHLAYVNNLNKAITGLADWQDKSIEDILTHLNDVPEIVRTAVRNNGGGHYNHSLFWQMMKPGGGGAPTGDLASAIETNFKSFDGFKAELTKAAMNRFGSGWAWLVLGPDKQLSIESTPNQDSPISEHKGALLGIDVWEHAYYLKHQNLRADYVKDWFNVVNWDFVADRYQKLMA
ncbi:MAG TPA: superoxide dismutase [Verrucomicrobiae bacterium]|nr:superoxide dismutase [Verrucomicrobiae bacterium]